MTLDGFPHSDIPGSKPACGSPGLIAACYVLHRLSAPRHPPSALCSLTIKSQHTCIRHQLSLCYPDSIFKERRLILDYTGWDDATSRRQVLRLACDMPHRALSKSPLLPGASSPGSPRIPSRAATWGVGRGTASSLVENTGIEPVTSWLQTRRSPN